MSVSLAGIPAFAGYFGLAVVLCVAYVFLYCMVTPNDERKLIFIDHNASASLALGMSLLGFSLPLASAIYHTTNLLECTLWGLIALIVQLLAYFFAAISHPNLGESLRANSMAAAIWRGFVSLTAGILSAVCMSW